MPDNFDQKDAANVTQAIAADDIGSVLYQRIKATFGPDGTATDVDAPFASRLPVGSRQSGELFITGQGVQSTLGNNVLNAVAGATATDLMPDGTGGIRYRSFAVQIVGGASISAGAVTFEGSNDNVTFHTLSVYDDAVITGTIIQGAITIAANTSRVFSGKALYRHLRCRISTAFVGGSVFIQAFSIVSQGEYVPRVQSVGNPTTGNLQATVTLGATTLTSVTTGTSAANLGKAEDGPNASGDVGVFQLGVRRDTITAKASPRTSADGDYSELAVTRNGAILTKDEDTHHKAYRASFQVSPAASATDIADMIGNATSDAFITRIIITGLQTTAGIVEIFLVRRSTANTLGTRVPATAVVMDSVDAAASCVPGGYSANPTTGTLVGNIRREYVFVGQSTSNSVGRIEWNFGDKCKPVIISGTTQCLAINLGGVTLTGATLNVQIDWYEN